MDDLIKFIKEKYIEDLVSPIDLHKLIIFFAFVGSLSLAIDECYSRSVWLEIGSTNVKEIFNFESKLWINITIFQILLSIILTSIIGPVYSKLKSDFFQTFSKIAKLNEYVTRLTRKIGERLTGNQALDLMLIEGFSQDLGIRKKKLIRFHTWGEVCICCLLISILGLAKRFNPIDLSLAFAFLITMILIQWRAYLYYIEKVLPVALPEKMLEDGKFNPDSEY